MLIYSHARCWASLYQTFMRWALLRPCFAMAESLISVSGREQWVGRPGHNGRYSPNPPVTHRVPPCLGRWEPEINRIWCTSQVMLKFTTQSKAKMCTLYWVSTFCHYLTFLVMIIYMKQNTEFKVFAGLCHWTFISINEDKFMMGRNITSHFVVFLILLTSAQDLNPC